MERKTGKLEGHPPFSPYTAGGDNVLPEIGARQFLREHCFVTNFWQFVPAFSFSVVGLQRQQTVSPWIVPTLSPFLADLVLQKKI